MGDKNGNVDFPYSLCILTPFPNSRLADKALRALQVDAELSSMVRRSFSLARPQALHDIGSTNQPSSIPSQSHDVPSVDLGDTSLRVLKTNYEATTNRMLRVAVNGFMESLALVVRVMEELDVDVLAEEANPIVKQPAIA